MDDKKPLTWEDIENSFKNALKNRPEETETAPEKLADFKEKLLTHLDGLQAEEDKKVISFSDGKRKSKKKQ